MLPTPSPESLFPETQDAEAKTLDESSNQKAEWGFSIEKHFWVLECVGKQTGKQRLDSRHQEVRSHLYLVLVTRPVQESIFQ